MLPMRFGNKLFLFTACLTVWCSFTHHVKDLNSCKWCLLVHYIYFWRSKDIVYLQNRVFNLICDCYYCCVWVTRYLLLLDSPYLLPSVSHQKLIFVCIAVHWALKLNGKMDRAADDRRVVNVSLSVAALAIQVFSTLSPRTVSNQCNVSNGKASSASCCLVLHFLSSPSSGADDEAANFFLSFVYSLNFNLHWECSIGQCTISISSSCSVVIAFRWYHCVWFKWKPRAPQSPSNTAKAPTISQFSTLLVEHTSLPVHYNAFDWI